MGVLMVKSAGVWIPAVPAGPPGPPGPQGAAGPIGPQGADGQATIIVGQFGTTMTPADLPPTGLIPPAWDAPGSPATPIQMLVGQSLFYAPLAVGDPRAGHLYQYVSTSADPSGWIDIGLVRGPVGAVGPPGPTMISSDAGNFAMLGSDFLLYVPIGQGQVPLGGAPNQALIKTAAGDHVLGWGGPYLTQAAADPLYLTQAEGDGRYSLLAHNHGASTTVNVSWQDSFSGTAQFRVNPYMVTLQIKDAKRSVATAEPARHKMFDYPSGVPAPWVQLKQAINIQDATPAWWDMSEVECNTDGVWFRAFDNRPLAANSELFNCTISWAR